MFEVAFASFVEGCKKIVQRDHETNFSNLRQPWLEVDPGNSRTRYIRIWKVDDWNREAQEYSGSTVKPSKTCYAFVDRTNGDVLKPATWKAPAKHARGNIFDASNGLEKMGPYGPAYLT